MNVYHIDLSNYITYSELIEYLPSKQSININIIDSCQMIFLFILFIIKTIYEKIIYEYKSFMYH